MKKVILLTILGFALSFSGRGQYVTIPDGNFAYFLQIKYPNCFVSGQLDTTCAAILNATGLYCNSWGIQSLDGIQYFKNLDTLDCSYNSIDTLDNLPSTLTFLNSSRNYSLTYVGHLPSGLLTWWGYYTYWIGWLYPVPTLPNVLQDLELDNSDFLGGIPALPDSLITFSCDNCELLNLPNLPASLQNLSCGNCVLDSLPALPAGLQYLECENNRITNLPPLPLGLQQLNCYENKITTLPVLPATLQGLDCDYNLLTALPALPDSLNYFDCGQNRISVMPALPSALTYFVCGGNLLTALPTLPGGITYMDCSENRLGVLPALPPALQSLWCVEDSLFTLPALPTTLTFLACHRNHLVSLPALPPNLNTLYFGANPLAALPTLPLTLQSLYGGYTPMNTLPALPQSVKTLELDSSYITSLPPLPDSLYYFTINNCPNLTCLPELKKINQLQFSGTPINCLPNYGVIDSSIPRLGTFPLCGIFNPNGCTPFWDISGQCYFDANSDCQFDSTDVATGYVKMQVFNAGVLVQQTFTGTEGYYSFDSIANGNYSVLPDTTVLPFTVSCPGNAYYPVTLSAIDTLSYNNNFAFKCRTEGVDLGVLSILNNWVIPRPTSVVTVNTVAGDMSQLYGALCAAGVSGQVQITITGQATYVGPAPGALAPSTVAGNALTWNIADFGAINDKAAFNILLRINTDATPGTQVCINVTTTSNAYDYNPANNTGSFCFTIVDALDPNEKEVYPLSPIGENSPWLTYTIRFQNTGTAPAVNIRVTDTLDNNLDPSTFQLLAYSAKNLTQVFGNDVVFNFPNINLPDSATSDSASRGFVQYKIKLKNGLPPGTPISNTAYIYFDLNSAVVTNTVTDSVLSCATTTSNPVRSVCQGDTTYIGTTAFTQTGVYRDTLTNAGGCDSVVTLTLTVNPLPVVTLSWDSLIAEQYLFSFANQGAALFSCSPDTEFALKGGNPFGGNYDGRGVINNIFYEDSADLFVGVSITISYYYVDPFGCGDTAFNYILDYPCEGIPSINPNTLFTLYPNPTDDYTTLNFDAAYTGATIMVKDITGRQLYTIQLTTSPQQLPTGNLPPGVYLVTMNNNGQIGARLLVKE